MDGKDRRRERWRQHWTLGWFRRRTIRTTRPLSKLSLKGWARVSSRLIVTGASPHSIARRRQSSRCRGPRSLVGCFGTSLPRSRAQNSTDVIAESWRSARERSSRATRHCAPIVFTRCGLFLLAMGLGWRFATLRIAGEISRPCGTASWSLLGSNVLAASAGWKSIWRMVFVVCDLPSISTFMAFPLAPSTKRTSSGSNAFILTIESGLRSTFWAQSQALTGTIKPNIA